jgi:hypothetical protein
MRKFNHPDMNAGFTCPFCGTGADQPVVLVPIPGTEQDGRAECKQFHADCVSRFGRMYDVDFEFEE